jgi:nucleotide-binding universal stress UspA family protein
MKRLLLAVDGTPSSRAARAFGLRWAKLQSAEVTGLAVLDKEGMTGSEAVPIGGSAFKARRDERHVEAARVYLEAELKAFTTDAATTGVKANGLLMTGEPVRTIVAEADVNDVIVLGRTTTFDLGDDAPGLAIVTSLLGAAPRPVIITPDNETPDGDVLVAFDGSLSSARALQLFALLGSAWRKRSITVLSLDEELGRAEGLAQRAASYLIAHDYRATPRPIVSARAPGGAIIELAKEIQAGLIVQGAFGNRSWMDFILGSTTEAMLKDARLPLFMSH